MPASVRAGAGYARLDTATLARSRAVVWHRRNVRDRQNIKPGRLKRTYGGLPTRTRSLYKDIHGLHPVFHGAPSGAFRAHLGSIRRTFTRTLKPSRTGTAPGNWTAGEIGHCYQCVVKRGMDVGLATRNDFPFSSPPPLGPLWCWSTHKCASPQIPSLNAAPGRPSLISSPLPCAVRPRFCARPAWYERWFESFDHAPVSCADVVSLDNSQFP